MMRFIIFRVGLSCSLALLTFAVASGQEFFDSSFLAPTQDDNGGGEIDAVEAPIEQTLRLATDPKLAEEAVEDLAELFRQFRIAPGERCDGVLCCSKSCAWCWRKLPTD